MSHIHSSLALHPCCFPRSSSFSLRLKNISSHSSLSCPLHIIFYPFFFLSLSFAVSMLHVTSGWHKASLHLSFFVSPDFNQHCSFVSLLFIYLSFSSPWSVVCVYHIFIFSSHQVLSLHPSFNFWWIFLHHHFLLCLGEILFNINLLVSEDATFTGVVCFFYFSFIFIKVLSLPVLHLPLSFLWRSITPHHLDPPFLSLHRSLSTCWFQSQCFEANLRTSVLGRKRWCHLFQRRRAGPVRSHDRDTVVYTMPGSCSYTKLPSHLCCLHLTP